MPLAEACAAKGVNIDEAIASLESAVPSAPGEEDWAKESLAGLAAYIVNTHHAYVNREMPRLNELAAKVVNRHGDTDLQKARDYYEGFLGFKEAFDLKNHDGSVQVAFIKINDHQYIELYVQPKPAPENFGWLHDAGFETNDAKGMRAHLASLGIQVPAKVTKDAAGNLSFDIADPSGFTIQIVKYLPHSMTGRTKGTFMPAARISGHIDHIGLLVSSHEASWKFYNQAFGFTKEGDGSKMAIPGGNDRFELGSEKKKNPGEARYHVEDHICLSNPDVPKMTAMIRARERASEFPEAIVIGQIIFAL